MVNDEISKSQETLTFNGLSQESQDRSTHSMNDDGLENNVASGNDSGHASNSNFSSPVSPLTPDGERASSPVEKSVVDETASCLNDSSFHVRIVAPGCEPFDLQVNAGELVQEIHQILLERESTCHRTCFSLQLDGVSLDSFTELKNIAELKDGCVLKVVEEPYTLREARIHLRHVRELIRGGETVDAVNGIDGASLSYLVTMLIDRKKAFDKSVVCSPPEYIMPGYKERPLVPLLPVNKDAISAVKNIAISSYNPPLGPRKIKGDILYLTVDTLEGRRYHITCCTKGFYVNATAEGIFRPAPSQSHKTIYHSLVDLLSSISAQFKKAITVLLKRRAEKQILERLPTPYQVVSWVTPSFEQTEDDIRAEDCTQPHRIGLEDHIPGQNRDWNEELQTTRELPRETVTEKIIRERAIFKIHSDFVFAAIKGAIAVIDGNVIPLNPSEEPRTRMYIWNNIFFSLGFDVKDYYKESGGDAAAHAATSNDLQGVHAYAQLDNPKLFTVGMVIIDYKGYRVTAQTIIPGILEREQEQSVVYGSIDFGKTVVTSEKYQELLEKPAEQLKILPHNVKNGKEDDKILRLFSSIETKGIIGNDSRHYILDLLRTFPPDVNYLEGVQVTDICKNSGFPRQFPHKLASLRQELVDAFVEYRYLMFIRIAAYQIQRMRINLSGESSGSITENSFEIQQKSENSEEKNEIAIDQLKSETVDGKRQDDLLLLETEIAKKIFDETIEEEVIDSRLDKNISKQIISKAAQDVGSVCSDAFEIRFNPDCFCSTVKHADNEDLAKQRLLVAEAAEFLIVHQLPNFVRDCLQHAVLPIDGISLIGALHDRGINVRYLGRLVNYVQDVEQLAYLKVICMIELICRSAKHIYRGYLQPVTPCSIAAAVAHFLNCLLSSTTNSVLSNDETNSTFNGSKRTKGARRRKQSNGHIKGCNLWANMSSKILWENLLNEFCSYYAFAINCQNIDEFLRQNNLQKTSILRRFAQMVGIQVLLKDYNLESGKKSPLFLEDDIQNIYPVCKHIDPRAIDANNMFIAGQAKVQQGAMRVGYDMVAESLNLMNNIYGAMHVEMGQCMRLLARLSYIMGDPAEALAQQHKATLISERCSGLDSAITITEYINLAHFSFANLHIVASLKLLYRARYLLLLVHGENHPLIAQIDGNIGVILYAVQEYDDALKFLQNALKLHQIYSEPLALKTALIYHLIARTQSCRGDFRSALQMEKETFSVYSKTFGEHHEKTKESSEFLKHLTQQAVNFQKRINEANRQGSSNIGQLLPVEVHRPSLQSILEVLNIINGIIFLHLKNPADGKDLEPSKNDCKPHYKSESDQLPSRSKEGSDLRSEILNVPCSKTLNLKIQEEALD